MAAITTHPAFPQPKNPSAKIWRYMDFAKFLDMLERKSLYFIRLDQLGDPFEGSYPKGLVDAMNEALSTVNADSTLGEGLANMRKMSRGVAQANCWHRNERESAAMWNLYARSNESIAVQTKYKILVRCLPDRDNLFVGEVTYIDYKTEGFPPWQLLHAFMHKRISFQHESEIRAVIVPLEDAVKMKSPQALGQHLSVNLDDLIEQVRVAPSAPQWFLDLVRSVSLRYGHKWPVEKSALDAEAIF